MFAILIIAAISAQAVFVQAQYNVVYVVYDPNINSVTKGWETCSYSSPSWINTFFHPRINIRSTFSERSTGNANPTLQKSFEIEFKRPGFTSRVYEGHNPQFGLSSTFTNGATNVPGWLRIFHINSDNVLIVDYNTASAIHLRRGGWSSPRWYNLYLYASNSYLARGGGLLYEGCPYTSVFPWKTPYNGNPNILGRKKRQVLERQVFESQVFETRDVDCSFLRKMGIEDWEKRFGSGLSVETLEQICKSDSQFLKDGPEQMQREVEAIKQAQELLERELPDGRPRCDILDEEGWERQDKENN